MKRTILALSALLFIMINIPACQPSDPMAAGPIEVKVGDGRYYVITAGQLNSMMNNKDFLLVNVHIPYEGEIAGTDLFIPFDKMEQNLSKLPADKGAKIVLYCRSGSMSATASRTMTQLGFTNIWDVEGGMIEWKNQGLNLTSQPR
ncbi:MAG: rhodanese-like domain-containing protein [Dehalococcoidia bacterium]|nr:rhodanese-like domain-containing protein [Dehalococcoidia bacterium]